MATDHHQLTDSVVNHTARVLDSFRCVRALSSEAGFEYLLADTEARFGIWAGNIGAFHAQEDPKSADHRLRSAPIVTRRLIEALAEGEETNTEIADIVSGKRPDAATEGYGDSPFSHEDGYPDRGRSTTELGELMLSLEDTITSLLKVSVLLRASTGRDRHAHAQRVAARKAPMTSQFDIAHVLEKYPKLARSSSHGSPALATKLGNGLTMRRQYFSYARDHHARTSGAESSTLRQTNAAASTVASTVYDLPDLLSRALNDDVFDAEDTESQASSAQSSTAALAEPELLTLPELQTFGTIGTPFQCPFCYGIVAFSAQRHWRRHVLADLRAWTCLFPSCQIETFDSFSSWSAHEQANHRRLWTCPICAETGFPDDQQMLDHLIKHRNMGGTTTSDQLRRKYAYACSPIAQVADPRDCPFCDTWSCLLRERRSHLPVIDPELPDTVPMRTFLRHVSNHQIQLALFVLPNRADIEGTDGSSAEQAGGSEGRGQQTAGTEADGEDTNASDKSSSEDDDFQIHASALQSRGRLDSQTETQDQRSHARKPSPMSPRSTPTTQPTPPSEAALRL